MGAQCNDNTGMIHMAQQEGDAVGCVASAPPGPLCGFHPGPARPTGSVLLGAGQLGDADVDEERRGWDAGSILGEEMDVAVACSGDSEALAEGCPPPS